MLTARTCFGKYASSDPRKLRFGMCAPNHLSAQRENLYSGHSAHHKKYASGDPRNLWALEFSTCALNTIATQPQNLEKKLAISIADKPNRQKT